MILVIVRDIHMSNIFANKIFILFTKIFKITLYKYRYRLSAKQAISKKIKQSIFY